MLNSMVDNDADGYKTYSSIDFPRSPYVVKFRKLECHPISLSMSGRFMLKGTIRSMNKIS